MTSHPLLTTCWVSQQVVSTKWRHEDELHSIFGSERGAPKAHLEVPATPLLPRRHAPRPTLGLLTVPCSSAAVYSCRRECECGKERA